MGQVSEERLIIGGLGDEWGAFSLQCSPWRCEI
jgi:hypothetical protein